MLNHILDIHKTGCSEITNKKTLMVKCNFCKGTYSRPQAYYPTINEVLAILAFSYLTEYLTLCTFCKP